MKELVLVPTYQRSDMLAVCLDAIREADSEIPIHVFPDRGTNEREICLRFPGVEHHFTFQHTYHGNTFNVMEALRWAHGQHASMVYIVEDDAIISPDFFAWSRAAFNTPFAAKVFAACGWRYSPDALPPAAAPDILIPWYLSVCCALPKRSLAYIVQHAKPEYYADMAGYLDAAFPQSSRRGTRHYEQDGLCLRVCESLSQVCAWPRTPRATHIGWRGYHMPQGAELEGSLDERIATIKLLLKSPVMLKQLLDSGVPPNIAHCVTCGTPLLTKDTTARTRCLNCFHIEFPALDRVAPSHYYLP